MLRHGDANEGALAKGYRFTEQTGGSRINRPPRLMTKNHCDRPLSATAKLLCKLPARETARGGGKGGGSGPFLGGLLK